MPRVDPINHKHIEHMRQSYVLDCAANTVRTELKCARTQSSSRCTLSLISGKLFPNTSHSDIDHIIRRRGHFCTFTESMALTHAVTVIKTMLSISTLIFSKLAGVFWGASQRLITMFSKFLNLLSFFFS